MFAEQTFVLINGSNGIIHTLIHAMIQGPSKSSKQYICTLNTQPNPHRHEIKCFHFLIV